MLVKGFCSDAENSLTAIIYFIALNHYNRVLFEDNKKNALHESLDMFRQIMNLKSLQYRTQN